LQHRILSINLHSFCDSTRADAVSVRTRKIPESLRISVR